MEVKKITSNPGREVIRLPGPTEEHRPMQPQDLRRKLEELDHWLTRVAASQAITSNQIARTRTELAELLRHIPPQVDDPHQAEGYRPDPRD